MTSLFCNWWCSSCSWLPPDCWQTSCNYTCTEEPSHTRSLISERETSMNYVESRMRKVCGGSRIGGGTNINISINIVALSHWRGGGPLRFSLDYLSVSVGSRITIGLIFTVINNIGERDLVTVCFTNYHFLRLSKVCVMFAGRWSQYSVTILSYWGVPSALFIQDTPSLLNYLLAT